MILGDLSITFTFKLAESRRDTDRPSAYSTRRRKEREREGEISHTYANVSLDIWDRPQLRTCRTATATRRPRSSGQSRLSFSLSPVQHSCCLGFFTFFRSPRHAPSVNFARSIVVGRGSSIVEATRLRYFDLIASRRSSILKRSGSLVGNIVNGRYIVFRAPSKLVEIESLIFSRSEVFSWIAFERSFIIGRIVDEIGSQVGSSSSVAGDS